MSSQEPEKKFSHSRILTARLKPNYKRERKIRRRLFTSSFKREIRKLNMVVHVKETAKRMYQKVCKCAGFFCLIFMFSLHLKLPNQSGFLGVTGEGGGG